MHMMGTQAVVEIAPEAAGLDQLLESAMRGHNDTHIDGGWPGSADAIRGAAESLFGPGAYPAAILLTHAHPDHFGSAADLARVWELPVGVIVDRSLPFCSFSFGNKCFDENCV